MMFWMVPKECAWSVKCLAKFEGWLAVLNASLCSRDLVVKLRPVCPTYALPQLGQVSLYTPDLEYGSVFCCLRVKRFCMLSVRNAIFMSAFLNRLVIKVVSLPIYVKVAQFCVWSCVYMAVVCSLDVSGGVHVVGGFLFISVGKALLCRMFCIVVISVL